MSRPRHLGRVLALALCVALSAQAGVLLPDGTPDPNDASLRLWIAADAGVTAPGSQVSTWADQSANHHDFQQTSATHQPTHVASVAGLNGQPAIRFDGTSAYMVGPANVYSGIQSTTFIVAQVKDPSPLGYRYLCDTGGTRHEVFYMKPATTYGFGFNAGAGGRIYNPNVAPFDDRYVLLSMLADSANSFIEVDGTGRTTGTIGGGPNTSPFALGTRTLATDNFFNGDMAEILIYNRPLSRDEQDDVGTYLEAKYGLATAYVPNYLESSGLVGYWDFDAPLTHDGTFGGEFGPGRGATPVNDAHRTTIDTALGAGALALDGGTNGTSDYITLPDLTAQFTDAATLTMWVKLSDAIPDNPEQTGICDLSEGGKSHYAWTNGQAYFGTFLSGGERIETIDLSSAVDREQWHLLTITRDGTDAGNWKLYQNGELVWTASPTSAFAIDTTPWIGASSVGRALEGGVDDLGLFSLALSEAEAKALYGLATHASLGYDLGQVAQLLGLYAEGGDLTLGGLTWRSAGGLATPLGEVVEQGGYYYLRLDDGGGGVWTLPEPTSLALLGLGALALLRRRRSR